jgi:hypothetical protein
MMGVFAVVGAWRAAGRAGPSPVMLAGVLIFLSIEAAASFSFWQSQEYEAFVHPAYNFAARHKAEKVYFPRSNYVTYLASGQYYPDDNMNWDRELLCGLGVPQNIIDMLEARYWDYIIGEFYSGALNTAREKNYQAMPDRAGTYTIYQRRTRPVEEDPVEE